MRFTTQDAAQLQEQRAVEDFYPSHELLTEIISLESERQALNGGGPGWSSRWNDAMQRACELMEG